MTEYSRKSVNLSNVDLVKLMALIDVIRDSGIVDIARLEKKFEEFHGNFGDNLRVLEGSGVIRSRNGEISNAKEFFPLQKSDLSDILIENLFKEPLFTDTNLDAFSTYLYTDEEGRYRFSPSLKLRLATSETRNFLISIGFLEFDAVNDDYFVTDRGMQRVIPAVEKHFSPSELKKRLARLEELGEEAEMEALKFEMERLRGFPEISEKIDHVSKKRTNAGYDIRSFSHSPETDSFSDRFIEVKAISRPDKRFFWSRNEIEKAGELRNRYYLYLVSMKAKGEIEIICDPISTVYKNRGAWDSTIELYSFSAKNCNRSDSGR